MLLSSRRVPPPPSRRAGRHPHGFTPEGVMIFESIIQDLRIGLRIVGRRPGFALMAASSLALGIGLVATQFSLIDGVLLRGLPFNGAQRLMHIARADPQQPGDP